MKNIRIGRNADNDIVLNDASLVVSRYHAKLTIHDNGSITICDLSTNGTIVNGKRITKGVETSIKRGDDVRFGNDIRLNWNLIPIPSIATAFNTPGAFHQNKVEAKAQEMFSNPFSFDGRIRRLEFGISNIIYAIIAIIINYTVEDDYNKRWLLITFIPLCWFMFAQGAKRCHDLDKSGWYQLIPFYGLWMLFAEGESGNNQYGNNPKN